MKGIVLLSHGRLADGLFDTLTMFTDRPQQLASLCLLPSDDIESFTNTIIEKIEQVDTGDGVILFCDLLFGTPCNCTTKLLMSAPYKDRIEVIAGMNLPMILEFISKRDADNSEIDFVEVGQQGIVNVNAFIKQHAH